MAPGDQLAVLGVGLCAGDVSDRCGCGDEGGVFGRPRRFARAGIVEHQHVAEGRQLVGGQACGGAAPEHVAAAEQDQGRVGASGAHARRADGSACIGNGEGVGLETHGRVRGQDDLFRLHPRVGIEEGVFGHIDRLAGGQGHGRNGDYAKPAGVHAKASPLAVMDDAKGGTVNAASSGQAGLSQDWQAVRASASVWAAQASAMRPRRRSSTGAPLLARLQSVSVLPRVSKRWRVRW